MASNHFQFSFVSTKQPDELYSFLVNPKNWWVGLFGETIAGKSIAVGDEFTFKAGGGMHYTKQKLVELIPSKKITWMVTESNLTFLDNTKEWEGTKISFDLEPSGKQTKVTFTHIGLLPEIECYDQCSSGWTQYLQNLKQYFE